MFLASTIILAAQTGVFAYSWFVYYGQKEVIRRDYYFWGNVVAIAQYALILLLFYKVFGAFKVGYLRIMDVLLSQVISLLCTNAFIYLEMNLIAMWKFGEHLAPMFTITAVDLLITVVWVFCAVDLCEDLSAKTDASDIWGLQSRGSGAENFWQGRQIQCQKEYALE